MALTDKLTAIGNAIRTKTGGTGLLTLDQMATEIANIQGGGGGGSWSTATITAPTTTYNKTFDISNYVSDDNKNWMLFLSATYSSSYSWETAFIAPFLSELYDSTKTYGLIYTKSRNNNGSSSGNTNILGYSDGFFSDPLNTDKVKYSNGVISWTGSSTHKLNKKAVLLYQD